MSLKLNRPNHFLGELKTSSDVLVARKNIYKGTENPEIYLEAGKIPKDKTFDQIVHVRNGLIGERKDLKFAEIPNITNNSFESFIAQLNHEELHPIAIKLLNLWFPNRCFNLFDIQVECVVTALQYYNFEKGLEFSYDRTVSFWTSVFKLALKLNNNHENQKTFIQESFKSSINHAKLLRQKSGINIKGKVITYSIEFVKTYGKISYSWNIDLDSTLEFVRFASESCGESTVEKLEKVGWMFSSGENKYEQLKKTLQKSNQELIQDFFNL